MIHPYRDGNGRTGRILNILYLLQTKIISIPALYISKYIIDNKREYYELLNKSGQDVNYVPSFVKYMLRAINITAKRTKNYILKINEQIGMVKKEIKGTLPKIYSHELVEALFYDLYTRAKFIMAKINVSRKTADRYLKLLKENGFLDSIKIGKEVIYINKKLNVLLDLIDG
ncbi:hypothetical protein FACS1894166_04700 [Bacilli bacterium]|nr:hypothetical protein FACS1894166_04700 [Bacilli bacterium]